jgi:hypothetical protein
MPIKFQEIRDALEFVCAGNGLGENQAYLCKQSGKIHLHSDWSDMDDELPDDDKLPDDVDDEEKYLEIPDRRELDLGKPLVLDFTRQNLPADFDEVREIFGRRGAYAGFKRLLVRRDALQQ